MITLTSFNYTTASTPLIKGSSLLDWLLIDRYYDSYNSSNCCC